MMMMPLNVAKIVHMDSKVEKNINSRFLVLKKENQSMKKKKRGRKLIIKERYPTK